MAIDVFCYVNIELDAANQLIHHLKSTRQDLFANDFIISSVRATSIIHDEIASEQGFLDARSLFLIHLNDKKAATKISLVAEVVRKGFGASNVLLLFENEAKI
jgi:4-aminobutyrate aminotransferase-like enzyme